MELKFYPSPSAEELEVRLKTRAFCLKHLRPTAVQDDEEATFRRDVYSAIGKEQLLGISMPKKYGGRELPVHCHYAMLEEIARSQTAIAITAGVNNLVQGGLLAFGNDTQKSEYLPKLISGEWLGAFSLSEPQSGSDAAALRLKAEKVTGGYRLNGTKVWCSNAGFADLYLVMARTSEERTKGITSFLIPATTPGFRVGKFEDKLGLRASSLAELIFENAFIPETSRLGKEGEGFIVALSQLDGGRITIGLCGYALAVETITRVFKYFKSEEAQGREILSGNKLALANFYAETQAIKSLLTDAARLKDKNEKITLLASQVKLLGSDLAMKVTSEAMNLCGEIASTKAFEIERLFRDSKALQIVEGTNQIQRTVLAREMEAAFHD